jgi:tetratricopeptide (TPR) repeat protein
MLGAAYGIQVAKYWAGNMIKHANQTIRKYAKISEIPLKQVLEDLKNSGFFCNADDVVDNKMRKNLSDCFRKRQRTPEGQKKAEELKRRKVAKAGELKRQNEAKFEEIKRQQQAKAEELKQQKIAKVEALKQLIRNPKSKVEAVVNAEWELEEIKIGLLLELCSELIPGSLVSKIECDYRYQSFRRITQRMVDEYGLIRDPLKAGIHLYETIYHPLSIEQFITCIKNYKKHNRYTSALIETIYFLLSESNKENFTYYKSIFKELRIVGELFIDMGAIDSALRLYKIDERVFNNPNNLGLLANKSVQSGNLDDSIKLVEKLIEQEPYHPSIPTLKAEVKRLEQRHRLKATFSIDFSKVNELQV